MGLQEVGDPAPARGRRHRQDDKVAAEVDVCDVESGPVAAQPLPETGCDHTRETSSGQKGLGSKQLDRHAVQLGGHVPVAPGGANDSHVVAAADQLRALVERHPRRAAVRPIRAEQRHHLQYAHVITSG